MAKFISVLTRYKADIGIIFLALSIHLWYLTHTTFVDWPEMLLYPWFLTKGLVYYRDVVLAYVPGAYYLLHGLYSVIGYSVLSERMIAYGFIFMTDILVYVTARRLTKSLWPSAMALFFFVLWQPIFSGNTIWYETILAPVYLVAYLYALRYVEKPTFRTILSVGITLAIATLIKQTAVWPLAAMCLFVCIAHPQKKQGLVHAFVIGSLTIIAQLAVWGYFALVGAGRDYGFWVFGFLFNLSQGTSMYALAPTRGDIILMLPALLPMVLLTFLRPKKEGWLLIFFTGAVFLAGLPRWGLHRLQPMLAFISVGFALAGAAVIHSKRYLVIGIIALCLVVLGSWRSFQVFITLRDPMQPTFFDGEYQQLVSYMGEHAPGDMYVLGNYDYLYFGRNEKPQVLPWVPLFPWNGRVQGIEERLIASIEEHEVPYILFVPFHPKAGYYDGYAPNELFLYVRSKYEKIGAPPVVGGELLKRR